jgi:hypothetical protein
VYQYPYVVFHKGDRGDKAHFTARGVQLAKFLVDYFNMV